MKLKIREPKSSEREVEFWLEDTGYDKISVHVLYKGEENYILLFDGSGDKIKLRLAELGGLPIEIFELDARNRLISY